MDFEADNPWLRGTSDFRCRLDVCLALRCRNHGGISSGASGNRHLRGSGCMTGGTEDTKRTTKETRSDQTRCGSNLLLQHHGEEGDEDRGTRLADERTREKENSHPTRVELRVKGVTHA
jgi:hypothetical protein